MKNVLYREIKNLKIDHSFSLNTAIGLKILDNNNAILRLISTFNYNNTTEYKVYLFFLQFLINLDY